MIRIATFNLNNLFDRFNFQVQLERLPTRDEVAAAAISVVVDGDKPGRADGGIGGLVKPKPLRERARVAERIRDLDADVLLVQEVEHRDALEEFNSTPIDAGGLGGMYRTAVCVDGNDPRRIDVGVLSRVPIGAITTWQHVVHPKVPGRKIFSRDLLEIDILSTDYAEVRATCFVTHLKSNLVLWERDQTAADVAAAAKANDDLRERQVEMIARILERRSLNHPYLVCGDMNDGPDTKPLTALRSRPLGMSNGLAQANEHPPYTLEEEQPPKNVLWTHRYRADGKTTYELFDHIWLDPKAADLLHGAGIQRRTKKTKDGTDHDAPWVDLDLDLEP